MPSSSIRFTSVASEKRGGGWVKCWVAVTAPFFSGSFSRIGGRVRLSSSCSVPAAAAMPARASAARSSSSSRYSFRKPSKAMTEPLARSLVLPLWSTSSTTVWSSSADCIWLATARFQTSSYSRRWRSSR